MSEFNQLARRLEHVLSDFANSISNGMTFEPSDFGTTAHDVAQEVLMMGLVFGHNITREIAISELAGSEAALSKSFGTHVVESVAEAVVDECEDVLFLEDE
jgi:hypothetical protein